MRVVYCLILAGLISCQQRTELKEIIEAESIHSLNSKLINISREDIYSPPVASRVFAYPNLAAYEVFSHKYKFSPINNVAGEKIKNIESDSTLIDYSVASLFAYNQIAKKLVFSEHLVDSMINDLNVIIKKSSISSERLKNSESYGKKIADQIALWIDQDNYAKVKSDDFYTLKTTDSSWVLTPPTFDQALEPNWNQLKPITLPNLKDFDPPARPKFDKDKNSEFYKHASMVYETSKNNTETSKIALFWDDNPNEYNNTGHNTYFLHKISPPAHWINITKIICKNNKADFGKSVEAYAKVTTAVFDAIISCWHTKYTHELIRPVTYINRYIDPHWEPLIQTPPFPEYTSGHSNISGASSYVLNELFANTKFVDDTEVEFGLPKKEFENVIKAGEEASISRFYGGIHYKFGVDNGFEQGKNIGKFVQKVFSLK